MWTHSLKILEAEGRFDQILESLTPISHKNLDQYSLIAKALAFTGKAQQSEKEIAKLEKYTNRLTKNISFRIALIKSKFCRDKDDYDQALTILLNTRELDHEITLSNLIDERDFALAICYCELGQPFRALDLFLTLSNTPRVSSFRKALAITNSSWLLWDLGREEDILKIYDSLPMGMGQRIKLLFALKNLNMKSLINIQHLNQENLVISEKKLLAILYIEAYLVFDSELDVKKMWIYHFLIELKELNEHQFFAEFCLSVLDNKFSHLSLDNQEISWRNRLDLGFILWLCHLKNQSYDKAKKIYQEIITPILFRYRLETPLIPNNIYGEDFKAKNLWQQKLYEMLFKKKTQEKNIVVYFEQVSKHIAHQGRTVDLKKSLTAQNLIQTVPGKKGQKISKKFIHENITASKYNHSLHGSRLNKLLLRTLRMIEEKLDLRLWKDNLDGTISLLVDLELK